jgi:hypothetical protein
MKVSLFYLPSVGSSAEIEKGKVSLRGERSAGGRSLVREHEPSSLSIKLLRNVFLPIPKALVYLGYESNSAAVWFVEDFVALKCERLRQKQILLGEWFGVVQLISEGSW